ncbi:hypothetical protein BZG36_02832 [Bifiguratus adelaidae]|uniref:Uncharacterized protein n=1 Tax=Bifiguratus adelaidae TaxID=1938954 RepID=A0A261Y0W1_9FUNG|nr:hypothetical protein BZG36_02832 [Bifiguratus adelaidae]
MIWYVVAIPPAAAANGRTLQEASWSVTSLLPDGSKGTTILSAEDTHRLLKLAHLSVPNRLPATGTQQEASKSDAMPSAATRQRFTVDSLTEDLNNIAHFVHHIQKVDTTGVIPMRGLWPEGTGLRLREDEPVPQPDLLSHAKRRSGHYYVIED